MAAGLKLSVLKPPHPERVCWGCDKYCPADDLGCANGSDRTPHPIELFGEDWREWSEANAAQDDAVATTAASWARIDPGVVFAPVDFVNDLSGDEIVPAALQQRAAQGGASSPEKG